MRIEKQADNTWLASTRVGQRLKLCESDTKNGAWYGIIDMIDADFQAEADRLKNEHEEAA